MKGNQRVQKHKNKNLQMKHEKKLIFFLLLVASHLMNEGLFVLVGGLEQTSLHQRIVLRIMFSDKGESSIENDNNRLHQSLHLSRLS